MFDIGFWELTMIGVVALLVIGPERLPKVARIGGFWFGKARGYLSAVKQELNRELRLEELKQSVQEESPLEEINQLSEELEDGMKKVSCSVNKTAEAVESSAREADSVQAKKDE